MTNKLLVIITSFLLPLTAHANNFFYSNNYLSSNYGLAVTKKFLHKSSYINQVSKPLFFQIGIAKKVTSKLDIAFSYSSYGSYNYKNEYSEQYNRRNFTFLSQQKIRSYALFSNVMYHFYNHSRINLCATLGIGTSINNAGTRKINLIEPIMQLVPHYETGVIIKNIAWNTGLDLIYKTNAKVNINIIGYRYNQLGINGKKLERDNKIKRSSVSGDSLSVHTITTGINIIL